MTDNGQTPLAPATAPLSLPLNLAREDINQSASNTLARGTPAHASMDRTDQSTPLILSRDHHICLFRKRKQTVAVTLKTAKVRH